MKHRISANEVYKIIAKILKTTPAKIIKIDNLTSIKNWDFVNLNLTGAPVF